MHEHKTKISQQNSEMDNYKNADTQLQKALAEKSLVEGKLDSVIRGKEELQEEYQRMHLNYANMEHKITKFAFDLSQADSKVEERSQRLQQQDEQLVRQKSKI